MRRAVVLLFIILFTLKGYSQVRLLEHPGLLEKIKSELYSIYSNDFPKSHAVLNELRGEIPGHPVVYFLEALLVYWEYYPLTIDNPKSGLFVSLLEKSTEQAKISYANDPDNLEGLFFQLFGRAFLSEFWADNGKSSKVLPYLGPMYRQLIEGMELQEKFKEFYFTTGLYNYYIEAYPEKHPAYKPIKLLFHSGDMQKGLEMLHYCSENATYVKYEANFFLSIINMNYENNPDKASEYAGSLYRSFPKNPLYAGRYAEVLIYNRKFPIAEIVVNNLNKLPGDFARMEYHLYRGLIEEKYNKNFEKAAADYKQSLAIAEPFQESVTVCTAIAYMGLGRYYKYKNDMSQANRYFRMAENISNYDYVINDR